MILTTTSNIEGRVPAQYLGILGAEVIFGANFVKDWLAQTTDYWGGRSKTYEKIFEDCRTTALAELKQKAYAIKADAILNVRFQYNVLGQENGMLVVAATGTAVQLTLSPEERERMEKREQIAAKANAPLYFVQIDGKERGPFSISQLQELTNMGRVSGSDSVRSEDGSAGTVEEITKT
jgi:uncharacterized protein YbjQ (UPF0145 family)